MLGNVGYRNFPTAFSPAALFAAAEPGVWFDPSDVANLAWRRNLTNFSQILSATVAENQGYYVNNQTGTLTGASGIVNNDTQTPEIPFYWRTTSTSYDLFGFVPAGAFVSGQTYTLRIRIRSFGSNITGFATAGFASSIISSEGLPVASSDGWKDVTVVFVSNGQRYLAVQGNNTNWGYVRFQVELGSTATEYQRITDVNTEVIARFPQATLYQDSAGTTPVTAPAQPVGLMLDKSQGLVIGPELFSITLNFANAVWTKQAAVTSSGQNTFTTNGGGGVYAGFLSASTTRYRVRITGTTTVSFIVRNAVGVSGAVVIPVGAFDTTFSSQLFIDDGSIFFQAQGAGTVVINSFSVRELPGNHSAQSTSGSRPTYGIVPATGRRNLVTYSEQFDNAAWTKTNATVTANDTIAPDGTTTADKLVEAANTGGHLLSQTGFSVVGGASYTVSVYFKAAGRTWAIVETGGTGLGSSYFWVNLSNGMVGTTFGTGSFSVTSVGNGWYRGILTKSASSTGLGILSVWASTGDTITSYAGDGTSGIFIWGAQLETGSTATAYQNVVTAFEVTEANVASLSYLSFDGIDDFMITPTITPGTDKAQLFAGVRNTRVSANSLIMETSTNSFSSQGSTQISTDSAGRYVVSSIGTVWTSAQSGTFGADNSAVVSSNADIAGDVLTLRINGTQVAQSTANQGTGNYLAYPMYLGRRAGTSLPFNGQMYGLITRFGANLTTTAISRTESWMNSKTGAY